MTDVIEIRMNDKVLTNSKVLGYLEDLTKGAQLDSFHKASVELQPLFDNCKPNTKFEVEMPYGIYEASVEEIAEVVNEVVRTRNANAEHYEAIRIADVLLSTKSCFQLNGSKPESKRGKPKQELAFE